jgi:hypothetical protein
MRQGVNGVMCQYEMRIAKEHTAMERALFKIHDDLMVALDVANETQPVVYDEVRRMLVAAARLLDKCSRQS